MEGSHAQTNNLYTLVVHYDDWEGYDRVVGLSQWESESMKQLNIWITGASSGIGKACALTLAGAGHHVLASARSRSRFGRAG